MKSSKIAAVAFAAVVGLMLCTAPAAWGHHGTAAYDLTKVVSTKARVTGWNWANPHCLLNFDVTNEKGKVEHWSIETYNPLYMTRAGWTKNTLKPGDEINITFHPAKNGTPNGYIREGDGKIMFQGKELHLDEHAPIEEGDAPAGPAN
jgi:hypothetical protein